MATYDYSKLTPERYLVWDVLRDTNPYYLNHHLFLVDFTAVNAMRDRYRIVEKKPPTYVEALLYAMGQTLPNHPIFNSYLRQYPLTRLAIYKSVDITLTVEKKNQENQPTVSLAILEGMEKATMEKIREELETIRNTPYEKLPFHGKKKLFEWIPPLIRMTLFRLLIKPSPERMRKLAGTCALTSVGASGTDITTPLSPKSLTVSLGKVKHRPMTVGKEVLNRSSAWVTLTYDHRIADGNQCARLGEELKKVLESGVDSINP